MSTEHLPIRLPNGTRLQSGIPSRPVPNQPSRAMGLNLTGVVTATYVMDDPNHFQNDGRAGDVGAISVYCDVLCYTNIPGMRWRFLPRCRVKQDRGGIHSGRVWKPRASTLDVTGEALDLDKGSNPANFDGDHVMVSFLNDNLNEPIIVGGIPHPSVDTGNDGSTDRQRIQLRTADGDPDFWKHHGAKYGVEDNGDFGVDTRFANDGKLTNDGKEKDPPTNGTGAQRLSLPLDAEFKVSLQDMATPESPSEKVQLTITKDGLVLEMVDDQTTLTITKDTVVIDVENGANPITITNGEIQLGGDGDKAVTLSGIEDELERLRDDHNDLADSVAKTRGISNWVMLPLIPNPGKPLGQTIKSVVEYVTKQSILPTGPEDIVLTNAPLDAEAGVGEFVPPIPPDPNNPLRQSGLYPGSSVIGDPSSKLVTLKE